MLRARCDTWMVTLRFAHCGRRQRTRVLTVSFFPSSSSHRSLSCRQDNASVVDIAVAIDLTFDSNVCASSGAQLDLAIQVHSMQRAFVYDTADVAARFATDYTPMQLRALADRQEVAQAALEVANELEEGPLATLQSRTHNLETLQSQTVRGCGVGCVSQTQHWEHPASSITPAQHLVSFPIIFAAHQCHKFAT